MEEARDEGLFLAAAMKYRRAMRRVSEGLGTLEDLREFCLLYPRHRDAVRVRNAWEELAFRRAEREGTLASGTTFLRRFPDGRRAREVAARMGLPELSVPEHSESPAGPILEDLMSRSENLGVVARKISLVGRIAEAEGRSVREAEELRKELYDVLEGIDPGPADGGRLRVPFPSHMDVADVVGLLQGVLGREKAWRAVRAKRSELDAMRKRLAVMKKQADIIRAEAVAARKDPAVYEHLLKDVAEKQEFVEACDLELAEKEDGIRTALRGALVEIEDLLYAGIWRAR
ncbi:MAG: hypothetical protein ACYTAF_16620 [Planctomycetota bacterium]|jgi:hypothetical protein